MKQQQTREDLCDWSDEKLPSLPTSVVTAALRRTSPLRLSAAAFPQEGGCVIRNTSPLVLLLSVLLQAEAQRRMRRGRLSKAEAGVSCLSWETAQHFQHLSLQGKDSGRVQHTREQ